MEITQIQTKELNIDFDIRRNRLVPEQVEMFLYLISSGVTLPPIRVYSKNDKWFIWDGRHRFEAYVRLKCETVAVEIAIFASDREAVCAAFKANLADGGVSLQPTLDDYKYFVRSLMKEGEENDLIILELTKMGLLKEFAERMVQDSIKSQKETNLESAVKAVEGGHISIMAAAGQFGVKPEQIKKKIHRQHYDMDAWRNDVAKGIHSIQKIVDRRIPILAAHGESFEQEAYDLLADALAKLERDIEAQSLPAIPPAEKKRKREPRVQGAA